MPWKDKPLQCIVIIFTELKKMQNLIQFEATIWAKHNTQWPWNKILVYWMKL